jgi:PKD repeat protein
MKPVFRQIRTYFIFISMIFIALTNTAFGQTSFLANAYSGCKPFNVQFFNTTTNATSSTWDFGNGSGSTQANPVNIYTNSGTYTVTLTSNSPSGISTTTTTITVLDGPVADFSSNVTSICRSSGGIQFNNISSSFDSCVWDFGDGTTTSVNSPYHIYNLSGNFTVTLVVYDRINGCSASITKNQYIEVLPLPVATLNVSDSVTCNKSQNFQFTGSGGNISNWLWNFGDGTSSNLQNPAHIYNDTGLFQIQVVITAPSGCTDTITKSDYIHILYNPVPPVTAFSTRGCLPFSTSFSTVQSGVAAYHWDLGDGATDSIHTAYHTYTVPGSYNLTLIVHYINGCTNQNSIGPIIADSIPSFTFFLANNSGCAPLPVQFINNNPTANYSWLWIFGDGDSSTQAIPQHNYLTDGIYTVSLYATNPAGCQWGYPSGMKVNVSSPQALFSPDKYSGCAPLTVNLNNQSINAVTYEWDFGDGTTSVAANPSHTYINPGVYTIRLIVANSNGCKDTFMIAPVTATVAGNNFNPLIPIVACAPFTINLSDNSLSSSWLWNFGDGTTSTLSNPSHTYNVPGTYIVSLNTTGTNGGCSQNVPNLRTIIINGGIADFTHTETFCPPYIGVFTDSSSNAVAWNWDFGDGSFSSLQNPSHTFASPWYHTVALTITTPEGCKVKTVKNLEVYFEPLTAGASSFVADTTLPMSVQFYSNTVGATYWLWQFGDGDSSSLEDPVHIYNVAGPYTITLTIGNDSCSRTYVYPPQSFGIGSAVVNPGGGVVTPPPVVYNCAPYTVEFNSPYPDATSWLWDFGDGVTSNLENPSHTYITSGNFQAKLMVGFPGGTSDSILLPDIYYVVAFDGNFNIVSNGNCNGIVATLQPDDTTASCSWELGDGNYSNVNTPTHIYPLGNLNYLVTLLATDTNGCVASSTQTFYASESNSITASTTRACAGDTIYFVYSGSKYSSYNWDFGDGNFSNSEFPYHVYNDSGYYYTVLTVYDSTGCSRVFNMTNNIQVFKPQAAFSIPAIQSSCNFVTVGLDNQSTGYDYLFWDFGNGQTSTQATTGYNYYTPGTYAVTLTVTKSVCLSTFTSPVQIVVPGLTADFSFTQSYYCSPVQQSFVDLSTDAVSWQWNFGDGTTDSIQNPTHTFISQPVSMITLIVEDIYGCVKTKTKPNVLVSEALFKISAATGCIPFTVSFDDSSSNTIGWNWDFGDGSNSTVANPVHTYNTQGTYDITLIAESSYGCFDTIIMNDLINAGTITANFTADSTTGCAPLLVQFTDQSFNAASWLWDFGDGSYSNLEHPTHIYNVPGNYRVVLIAYDSLGCADTMTMPASIIINGSVPMFTISTTNGCLPVVVNIDNLSTGAVSYEWNFGNGVIDSNFEPVYQYTQSGSYLISLTTMDSSGCRTVFTNTTLLVVNESPDAIFTYTDTAGCSPFTPDITNKSLFADSLVWDFGDGTIISGTNPIHTYLVPGTYYISLYAYNVSGCSDSLINVGPFHVGATPDAAFITSDSSGCFPLTVQFSNTSSGLFNPVYYWDFGNGDTSSAYNPTAIFNATGSYDVSLMVTNQDGCFDKYSVQNLINVYDQSPPPATRIFTASVNDTSGIDVLWHLINLNDIAYYTLYRLNNSTNHYDSIGIYQNSNSGNVNIPSLNDQLANPSIQPYSYKVLAVDKCGSKLALDSVTEHTTVFLEGLNNNQAVSIHWSAYGGCTVSGYNIYRSDATANNFQLIATVDSATLYYNDLTTFCPFIYYYKVEAINICGEINANSFSNKISVDHSSYQWDQLVDLTRATVVNNSFVLVEWLTPAVLPQTIIGYDLYRSYDQVNYQILQRVNGNQLSYEDHSADIMNQNYYYKVKPVNYCDVVNSFSNDGSSILLKGLFDDSGRARLRWTSYSNWNNGVDYYTLERLNDFGVWEQIKTLGGITNEADD